MESIFEKRLTVTPDYCDASGALSPLAAFTIFQGIAAQHAEVLGVGSSAMAKKDGRTHGAHVGGGVQRARRTHVPQLHTLAR